MNMQISFVLSFANGSTRGAFLPSCAIQGFPSWFAVLDCKSRIVCGTEGRNCTVIAQGRAGCRWPALAGPEPESGEEVNRQAMAARRGGFQQLQRAVKLGHVPVRRDNIGAVGLDRHAVRNFEDLDAGITLDQFGEDALVVQSQVLHQDESHVISVF